MKNIVKNIILCFLVLAFLVGCSANNSKTNFKEGVYTTEGAGLNGPITVEVKFSKEKIEGIKVVKHVETPAVSDAAIANIPMEIVNNQTLNVDVVTGATFTSKGIIEAVSKAVKEAGGDPEKMMTKVEKKAGDLVKMSADVIIVGGGGAGVSAAVAAGESGASVIVIEKAAMLGGNTVLAGGGYNCFDLDRQKKQEMNDGQRKTVEKLLAEEPKNDDHKALIEKVKAEYAEYNASGNTYLFDSTAFHALQSYAGGDYLADVKLVEEFTDISADMLVYLEENGVVWKDTVRTYLGALWPRSHEAQNYKSGAAFIDTFKKIIDNKKLDVNFVFETSATNFIMENGKVIGVKAVGKDGTPYEFYSNKGVILATGGFAGNKELRKEYDPSLLDSLPTTNSPSVTGDGIYMLKEINASLIGMDKIQSLPPCNPVTGDTSDNVGASTGLIVNKEGVRFVNETERRDVITKAILEQTDGQYYVIVNEKNLMVDAEGKNKNGVLVSDLVKAGSTIKADTIAELAKALGMDKKVLQETVDKFQKAYDSKNDPEFGRTIFDEFVDLSAGGPYYATLRAPAVHHTMGGAQIDLDTHVIDINGKIIPGLYAAGEVTGGIHGGNRLGGNAVPDALAFGRLAGKNAAEEK